MSRRTNRRNELLVGALVLLAGLVFTWMSVQVGALKALGDTVTVSATFNDAAGLVPDAAVKIAGVKVGAVRSLEVDFDKAVVTMVLDRSANVREDVRAQIRARSLLGEKYVALKPKSPEATLLADGGTISNVSAAIDIDDLLRAIGPLLEEVKPEDVSKLVAAAGEILEAAGDEAPELLAKTNSLLDTLNEAGEIVPTLKSEVPALMRDLRATTKRVNATIETVDALLVKAETIATDVEGLAGDAPDALAEVRAMIAEVQPGMDDLRAAMEQSDEAVASLRKVLSNVEGLDEAAVTRILREEGVLVRVKPPKPTKR
ncbi:MAG: MCE family protein [Deltaproteobacteria bacterium]|nr:MCE family protein [Deltaproteobacteria bacterium]